MSTTSNILALDYGLARIGLALHRHEEGLDCIEALHNETDVMTRLASIIRQYEITVLVIGLPRNLDGDDTPQTTLVREFAHKAARELEVEVALQDEANTTALARQRLEERKRPFKREDVDSEAAAIILEDYLHDHA